MTTWNGRAMGGEADPRQVYQGPDAAEAVRVFGGLGRWKRRGIVEMTGPTGLVSISCRTGDPATSWETRHAHPAQR